MRMRFWGRDKEIPATDTLLRSRLEAVVKEMRGNRRRHLDLEDRETISRWAAGQARRFAHLPTVGIRNLLLNGPDGGLDAFMDGLDAKLVAKLRRTESTPTSDGTNDDPQA